MANGVKVYDIRHYGARPGQNYTAVTQLAVQTIFDQIKHEYADAEPPPQDGQSARVFFPFDGGEGWWVQGLVYQGNVSVGLYLIGEHALARGGRQGTALVYNGPLGGTLLDLIAVNGSEIRDLEFNLNAKARIGVWLRQKYVQGNEQVGPSSGVNFHSCSFYEPGDFTDSALVAAGKDDKPGATFQASEYRFFNCQFHGRDVGPGSKQGWGFRALNSGNTKNFTFSSCLFAYLYRGIEAMSGYVVVTECNASNIGGYNRRDAALFYGGGNVWSIVGGGMENGTPTYAARFVDIGQATKVTIVGCYMAGTPYADDYIIKSGGALTVIGCDFEGNSRYRGATVSWAASTAYSINDVCYNCGKAYRCITAGTSAASAGPTGAGGDIIDGTVHWAYFGQRAATAPEWAPSTAYVVGDDRWNGIYAYRCITAGTSANSGGPTGTGVNIEDDTAHWRYMGLASGNVLRIQATGVSGKDGGAWGGCIVENCTWRYNFERGFAAPIYDGSGNHIAGSPFTVASGGPSGDYSRSLPHKVRIFGCNEGTCGGNADQHIADHYGGRIIAALDQGWRDYLPRGCTVLRNDGGVYMVRVPYTAIQAAEDGDAASRKLRLMDLPAHSLITGARAELTELFGGPSGKVMIRLGCDAYGDGGFKPNHLLLPFDAKTGPLPVRIGLNKHLGIALAAATRDQVDGYMARWDGMATIVLYVTATSGTGGGAIDSLTAGSVDILITYRRLLE